jgi:hypothetical protein
MVVSFEAGYQVALGRVERLRLEAAAERLVHAPHNQEVTAMATEKQIENDKLRTWARERVESQRRLRLRLAVFALAMLVLTPVWAVSEYLSSGGWPQRLSPNDNPGDWSPWIIWVALAWTFYLALNVLVIHFRRPPVDDREIERELKRITRHLHA